MKTYFITQLAERFFRLDIIIYEKKNMSCARHDTQNIWSLHTPEEC